MAGLPTAKRRAIVEEDGKQLSEIVSNLSAGQYMELAGAADEGDKEPLRALLRCHGDAKHMKIQGIDILSSTVAIGFAGAVQVVVDVLKEQNDGLAPGLDELDSQGYAPLHHATMMGYSECVRMLLEAGAAARVATADSKYLLGQSTPIYLEGGLLPMHLAAEKGHPDICQILLEYSADVTTRSSFGLTPLDIALEKLVMQKANGPWLKVASHLGMPSPDCTLLPSPEEVSARRQWRMKSLRDRIVEDAKRTEAAKRASDLHLINERYVPLDAEIMQGGRKDGCSLVPGHDTVLWAEKGVPGALCRSLQITGCCDTGVEEPFPGIYVFELLSEDVCTRLWAETLHYLEAAKHCNLPLPLRHDGGLDLAYVFPTMLGKIAEAAMPAIRELLPAELHDIFLQHAFRTYNFVGREESFKRHVDKYAVTLNVCLHKTLDVQGSGVLFYESQNATSHAYRYEHKVGRACLHSSKEWHMTETLTAGERGSIIMWFNNREFSSSEL